MFEEHKAEQEAYFSGPAVMSASHRRALIHCAVYSRSEIKEMMAHLKTPYRHIFLSDCHN
jgi:hypothetical protein